MISSTGNINTASYSSLQNSINSLSTEKMFRKLSGKSGDGNFGVAKNDADNGIGSSDSDDNQLLNNGIIRDDSETTNVSYLRPKAPTEKVDDSVPQIAYGNHKTEEEFFYDGKASPPLSSFDSLAAEIGAIGDKISKQQLMAYLDSLSTSGTDNNAQIAFVKNLIAKFDTIADGADYITSLTGLNEPQDYKTVTPEQVTPPFDLRV